MEKKTLGNQKAPQGQPPQLYAEEYPQLNYTDSALEKEIKQRAATALHDHSVLLIRALSMNETPAKARLRMYRHLTGQPQPLHESTPAKRKHKEAENTGNATSTSTSSRAAGSSSSSSSTAAQGQAPSRQRRDIIPVDEEFAHTYFQGPLSS